MKNSRKTAVLLAALLSVSLCACGPVEEAADSVSETKDTTTAEAVSDTPDSVEESSQTDDSSQVEIIRDPELVCDLSEIPYTAKCTVEGNFGAEAIRTKEIGILRSIGASKRDISRVFNAETVIVGFVAGALGIIISYLLTIPINMIIAKTAEIKAKRSLRSYVWMYFIFFTAFILILIWLFQYFFWKDIISRRR